MAEISLKIKSDFEKAAADFKKIDMSSESFQKSLAKLQTQMANGSIDKFMQKNQLAATAMTAAKGATAGLQRELSGLQSEIQRLIKKGIDPLDPSLNKMKTRMSEIQGQLPQATGKFAGLSSAVMSLGAGFGAYQIANKIYDIGKASLVAAANMEQQTVAFTTMLDSAAMAENLLTDLQAFAAATPFSFNELTEASRKMIAFGFSAKEIIPNMRMLGDVAAGLSQPVGDIAYLFGQVKTQGKAMTQDLNQFANRGIPIYDELAKVLGISTGEVRKFAEQGKIGFGEIEQAFKNMTGEGGKFGGLMAAQAETLSGKWSNFGDNLDRIAVTIGQKMAPAAESVLDFLNVMTESDTSEFQRQMSGIVKLQEQYIDLRKKGFTADYQKGEIMDSEKLKGILIPINATSEERLAIYKKIVEVGKEEAQNMGLIARTEMGNLLMLDQHKNKIIAIADAYRKANPNLDPSNKDKPGAGTGTKKTESQMMMDDLAKMKNVEAQAYADRLKSAEEFFVQKSELEKVSTSDLMAWQFEQASLIASNEKLSYEQKLAAMKALDKAVQKSAETQVRTQLQFGTNIIGATSDLLTNIQTVMKNSGKESRTLAIAMKGLAMAQSAINTALAITKTLADGGPFPLNVINAAIIGAAGVAQQVAIATTPIPSAQTGLSSYEVPDIRSNRNDGASVKAQAGETVSITPRGESDGRNTSVKISIGEYEIFSVIQKGIDTGQIDITNKNIGRGVFAN